MFIFKTEASRHKTDGFILLVLLLLNVKTMARGHIEYHAQDVSIKLPATWEKSNHPSTKFLFFRQVEEAGQQFRENISLVEASNKGLQLTEYCAACKKQLSPLSVVC